ncbi:MAG: cation:proton antiporter [Mariprofundales bacterium]
MLPQMHDPTAVFVLAVLVAVAAQVAADRLRIPPILPWLVAGMALGPFGIHVLHAEALGEGLHTLIELGLAIILFEGGLNLNLKALHAQRFVVGRLVVFGPLLNVMIGGAAAHWLVGMDWPLALLFGAIVAVGGPTVVAPILRQVRVNRELSHILTSEAMLIDAVGAIIAIVLLPFCLSSSVGSQWQDFLPLLGMKLVVGIVVGLLAGGLMGFLLRGRWIVLMELRMSLTLALVWGTLVLADAMSSQAGLLAVLVAGGWLQKQNIPDIHRLRHFKGTLAMLLISVLFVLLSSTIDMALLWEYLWQGMALFLVLTVVVRPLVAWLAASASGLTTPQIGYIALMAPRGVVAAAVASLFAMILADAGVEQAPLFEALVFVIILLSVVFYSAIAAPLSRWLAVSGANDRSVLIVGGGQMGLELGRTLAQSREVRYLDLNTEVVTVARRLGYPAVAGNALDSVFMEVIHAEEVGSVLVMTGSTDHNLLIASLAREQFHVPNLFVAIQDTDEKKHAETIRRLDAHRLFGKPWTFTYWQDQASRKRLMHEVQRVDQDSALVEKRLADLRIPHGVQPLAVQRAEEILISHDDLILQAGDELLLLLRPERVQEGMWQLLPPAGHTMTT